MTPFKGADHFEYFDEIIRKRIKTLHKVGDLLLILVGENPASLKYVGVKIKLCEAFNIPVKFIKIDENQPDEKIIGQIASLFEDPKVAGGIVQIPLPRESLNKIFDIIPSEKDVDLISSTNIALFAGNDFSRLTPVLRATAYFMLYCVTPSSPMLSPSKCLPLLQRQLVNKSVSIIGRGFLVGAPIAHLLTTLNISLYMPQRYHTGDKIYSEFAILGAGKPNLVNGEDIQTKCNVLDFGTTVVDGKIVGDLNKNSVCDQLGFVSFSPGGIGPLVVRFLLMNHLGI